MTNTKQLLQLELNKEKAELLFKLLKVDAEKQKKIIKGQSKISNVESGRERSLKLNVFMQIELFAFLQKTWQNNTELNLLP